ncbi:MAG: transcriptional repressor LexA [Verrucomicrobiia bacterium]
MQEPLTPPQQKLLTYILDSMRGAGRPPTVREICHAFGYRSTGTARDHLHALETKGHLKKLPGKSRGLVPRNWPDILRAEFPPMPILGRVPAGGPLLAEENIEGTLDLSEEFAGEKVFALKVHGDSMIEAGICEDDLVVVRAQNHAEPGEIVVALVDGESTVKRLARRNGKLWLQPANPRYQPIPVAGDTKVLGKVIGVIRSYERKF